MPTLTRVERNDPAFPKPGQLTPGGKRLWFEPAVDEYLRAKLSVPAPPNASRVSAAVEASVKTRTNKLAARKAARESSASAATAQ